MVLPNSPTEIKELSLSPVLFCSCWATFAVRAAQRTSGPLRSCGSRTSSQPKLGEHRREVANRRLSTSSYIAEVRGNVVKHGPCEASVVTLQHSPPVAIGKGRTSLMEPFVIVLQASAHQNELQKPSVHTRVDLGPSLPTVATQHMRGHLSALNILVSRAKKEASRR